MVTPEHNITDHMIATESLISGLILKLMTSMVTPEHNITDHLLVFFFFVIDNVRIIPRNYFRVTAHRQDFRRKIMKNVF